MLDTRPRLGDHAAMRDSTDSSSRTPARGETPAILTALLGWLVGGLVLLFRIHQVINYEVLPIRDLPVTGILVLAGLAVAGAVLRFQRSPEQTTSPRMRTLLLVLLWLPTGLALLRFALPDGMDLPRTILEPLAWAAGSGWLLRILLEGVLPPAPRWQNGSDAATPRTRRLCLGLVVLSAAALGTWWYLQSVRMWELYLLGYYDFGHFARRVANTAAGRGVLLQTPGLPPFWDHFNPGLLLLVPLWMLWPSVKLYFLLQAFCLASPAVLVYALARRLRAEPLAATAWALAYLCYPALGQLNLSFSYGWHPISCALPLLFGVLLALASGRPILAGVLALAALSFKEELFLILAGGCLGVALLAWRTRRTNQSTAPARPSLTAGLPPWVFLLTAGVLTAGFVVVYKGTGLGEYQSGRFASLGDGMLEVLLSPIRRPDVFWGRVFRLKCLYYLLVLWVPLGVGVVLRGWRLLPAVVLPLGVLMVWDAEGTCSIAMQYATSLIPFFLGAALLGAASVGRCRAAGLWALGACFAASICLGLHPWSQPTISVQLSDQHEDVWRERKSTLDQAVRMVSGDDQAVVATGRAGAHLLGVGRLEHLHDALTERRALLQRNAGDQPYLRRFDSILIDRYDFFQQSEEEMRDMAYLAEESGFKLIWAKQGVLVFRRDDLASGQTNLLDTWRVSHDIAAALPAGTDAAEGLRLREAEFQPDPQSSGVVLGQAVFQATTNHPPNYRYCHVFTDPVSGTVYQSPPMPFCHDNWPTHWWREGETYREDYRAVLPERLFSVGAARLRHSIRVRPE